MRAVVLLFGLAACVRSGAVTCADGTVCPQEYTCDAEHHRCISPTQLRACSGVADGEGCTTDLGLGRCRDGVCDVPVCGDGVREGTEECDGADLGGADCTSSAQIHAQFYEPAGLACTAGCTFDIAACTAYCGDGTINGPEVCDGASPPNACVELGFDAGATACNDLCGFGFDSCARFGFQFEAIGPGSWVGIGGTSHTDQWAVGEDGVAAHYNGHAWSVVATGLTGSLDRVWAVAPDDVWAIGASLVAHYNGAAWTAVAGVPPGAYRDVWAAGAGAVFVATDHGVARWDGAGWQVLPGLTEPVFAVVGTSATDLWAAGADVLYHWTGSAWTPSATMAARHLLVLSPSVVWAVGRKTSAIGSVGTIGQWNGTAWTLTDDVNTVQLDIAGSAPNDVWVVSTSGDIRHWNGRGFIDAGLGTTLNSIHSFGPGDVVIVDGIGARRFRGQMYFETIVGSPVSTLSALWGDGTDDIVVGDVGGRVHRFDGMRWLPPLALGASIGAVTGFGPDDVFVSAVGGIVDHLTGGTLVDTGFGTNVGITNMWGTSNHDLWVAASSPFHYDGATWMHMPIDGTPDGFAVHDVGGTSASDVWVTGGDVLHGGPNGLYHWDGTAYSLVDGDTGTEIAAVAPGELFVVGAGNRVLHYVNGQRTEVTLPSFTGISHIAATAPDDVIVASTNQLFHFDGAQWSPIRVPTPQGGAAIVTQIGIGPGFIAASLSPSGPPVVEVLLRTRPWACRAKETSCHDAVDDDCDDLIDALDPDCQ